MLFRSVLPRGVALEDNTDLGDARQVGDVDIGDEGSAVGHAANQVLPGEALQCLPDRCPPDLELVAEAALLDHRPGRHVEAHDPVSYPEVGHLALRAHGIRDGAPRSPRRQHASLRSQTLLTLPKSATDQYAADIPVAKVAPARIRVKSRALIGKRGAAGLRQEEQESSAGQGDDARQLERSPKPDRLGHDADCL